MTVAWKALEEEIDLCSECKRLGSGLILTRGGLPVRPPPPRGGELLFISEAPTPEGGFWAPPPTWDGLRDKLVPILRGFGVNLPEAHADDILNEFLLKRFFLVQTIKWPLYESARLLGPTEVKLIEHSVDAHLGTELKAIRPRGVVLLGKVACYAAAKLFGTNQFPFARSTKLSKVRGDCFTVSSSWKADLRVHPTGLPVPRRQGDLPLISTEVSGALLLYWNRIAGAPI